MVLPRDPAYCDTAEVARAKAASSFYLKAGREVAIDGRLLFDEFQTQDGSYASRVYVVAERVEFLASRNRSTGQSPTEPAAVGGEAHGDSAA
jgi:single-strand DNA-binding protein